MVQQLGATLVAAAAAAAEGREAAATAERARAGALRKRAEALEAAVACRPELVASGSLADLRPAYQAAPRSGTQDRPWLQLCDLLQVRFRERLRL